MEADSLGKSPGEVDLGGTGGHTGPTEAQMEIQSPSWTVFSSLWGRHLKESWLQIDHAEPFPHTFCKKNKNANREPFQTLSHNFRNQNTRVHIIVSPAKHI